MHDDDTVVPDDTVFTDGSGPQTTTARTSPPSRTLWWSVVLDSGATTPTAGSSDENLSFPDGETHSELGFRAPDGSTDADGDVSTVEAVPQHDRFQHPGVDPVSWTRVVVIGFAQPAAA